MLCSSSWAELFAVAFASNSALLADLDSDDPNQIANTTHAPDGLTLTLEDAVFFRETFQQEFRAAVAAPGLTAHAKARIIMDVNPRCSTNREAPTVWSHITAEASLSTSQQHQLAMFFHDVVTQKAIDAVQQGITNGAERRDHINKALGLAVSAVARVYTECTMRGCE